MSNPFRKREQPIEQPEISVADALGIQSPKMSETHKAGVEAAAALAQQRANDRYEAFDAARKAREQLQREADEALWARIQARQRSTIGGGR